MSAGGAFVISLDFELHWGVRDKTPVDGPYAVNLHGARTVIPRILELFREFDVGATWATVGFLFAKSSDDLDRLRPTALPQYADARLNPYAEPVGATETDDPLHFAPSLLARIRETPRQEIATHTYSHYYCLAPGQDERAFRADLAAAVAIARDSGTHVKSIVFPRNQHNPAYDRALLDSGIVAYRGKASAAGWEADDSAVSRAPHRRAARLIDSYLPVSRDDTVAWHDLLRPSGLVDVRASRFLRPYNPAMRAFEPLRLRRITSSVRRAAAHERLYHLWWHPHNFGRHQAESLRFLRRILDEFSRCRDRHGMESLTMFEVACRIRESTFST